MSARTLKTWGDIKLATLQKLFSSNGTQIVADSSTSEYINAMPQACMEALQMLATVGKFIIKEYDIQVEQYQNLLNTGYSQYRLCDESIEFTAKNVGTWYFEILGEADLTFIVDGTVQPTTHIVSDLNSFSTFKATGSPLIGELTMRITASTPVMIKNVCMLHEHFNPDDDGAYIPSYGEYLYFRLPELIEDYYQLAEDDIYYVNPSNEPSYIAANNIYQEANNTLVIPRSKPGTYRVYYKAYPEQIDLTTADDYELPLDPEVATLLPLYMASQLYKDDDNAIATVYRNEFEVAFERLQNGSNIPRKEEFVSTSGW